MPDQVSHAVGTLRNNQNSLHGHEWRFQFRTAGGRLWISPQPGKILLSGRNEDPPFDEIEFPLIEFWDAVVEAVVQRARLHIEGDPGLAQRAWTAATRLELAEIARMMNGDRGDVGE